MKLTEKIKTWIKGAGLRSVGYVIGGTVALLFFGSQLLFGVGLGVFLADNIIVIKELIKK